MSRKEEIIEASIEYTMKNKPNVLAGDRLSEEMKIFNRNKAFEAGAKWADEHPNLYNDEKYFDKTIIDKACEIAEDILSSYSFANYPREMQDFLVDFRKAMEE